MDYTRKYTELKSLFNSGLHEIKLPWSGVRIFNTDFQADFPPEGFLNSEDHQIGENSTFSYPVFTPVAESKKVILLLHGLNERSWVKYLAWAHWLAENTSSYVILFPISFHINRSPDSWKDPRIMMPHMQSRNLAIGKSAMLSFANVALSNRLTEDPMRFFNSGYQTASDLIKLLKTIKAGKHAIIPGGCKLNIFGYSIGAFLAEIIMLTDPESLFSESKLFMLCGGSYFSNMNGRSKLIMDSYAFDRVYRFYLDEFENSTKGKSKIAEFLRSAPAAISFRSMIDGSRFKSFREKRFKKLKDQIKCSVLRHDTVIPCEGVIGTLSETGRKSTVRVHDFTYPYSHENPFPVFGPDHSGEVDRSFETIFTEAESFFG